MVREESSEEECPCEGDLYTTRMGGAREVEFAGCGHFNVCRKHSLSGSRQPDSRPLSFVPLPHRPL